MRRLLLLLTGLAAGVAIAVVRSAQEDPGATAPVDEATRQPN